MKTAFNFSARIVLLAVLVIIASTGCPSKKESTLSGQLIIPEGQRLQNTTMAATLNGEKVAEAKVDPASGKFTIKLPGPGTYDLVLRHPEGKVPFIVSLSVEAGQQATVEPFDAPADLFDEVPTPVEPPSTVTEPPTTIAAPPSTVTEPPSTVDVPPSTVGFKPTLPDAPPEGQLATINGAVHPEEATIKIMSHGKLIAEGNAAGGSFEIPSVPAGLYDVEYSAPGYDTVYQENVVVMADAPPADLNSFLLYVSPLDGVNWDNGTVTATGLGQPNPEMPAAAAAAGACRAAQADAYRKLLDTLVQIQVDPGKSIASMDSDGTIRTSLTGFIKGARVVSETKHSDGACEVTLVIQLHGDSGVTSFIKTKISP